MEVLTAEPLSLTRGVPSNHEDVPGFVVGNVDVNTDHNMPACRYSKETGEWEGSSDLSPEYYRLETFVVCHLRPSRLALGRPLTVCEGHFAWGKLECLAGQHEPCHALSIL